MEARQVLGKRIRTLLAEQNFSVRGFALMVGLSKDYVVDLEYGRKSPTLDTLVKVSAGFGITPSELLKGIGEPDNCSLNESSAPKTHTGRESADARYYSTNL